MHNKTLHQKLVSGILVVVMFLSNFVWGKSSPKNHLRAPNAQSVTRLEINSKPPRKAKQIPVKNGDLLEITGMEYSYLRVMRLYVDERGIAMVELFQTWDNGLTAKGERPYSDLTDDTFRVVATKNVPAKADKPSGIVGRQIPVEKGTVLFDIRNKQKIVITGIFEINVTPHDNLFAEGVITKKCRFNVIGPNKKTIEGYLADYNKFTTVEYVVIPKSGTLSLADRIKIIKSYSNLLDSQEMQFRNDLQLRQKIVRIYHNLEANLKNPDEWYEIYVDALEDVSVLFSEQPHMLEKILFSLQQCPDGEQQKDHRGEGTSPLATITPINPPSNRQGVVGGILGALGFRGVVLSSALPLNHETALGEKLLIFIAIATMVIISYWYDDVPWLKKYLSKIKPPPAPPAKAAGPVKRFYRRLQSSC